LNKEIDIKDYFPAYDRFTKAVGQSVVSDETFNQWTTFVTPYLEDGTYQEQLFVRQFLIRYRDRFPRPPGCSVIIFDFERPVVLHPKAFLVISHLLYRLEIISGGSLKLARIACWGFKTSYKTESFAALLRKGVYIEDVYLRYFKKFKITTPPRK